MSELTISKEELSVLENTATQVRRDIVRMVNGSKSGHPGGAMGCADWFVALYFKLLSHDKDFKMDGINEDLVFLSNGHISAVWYSTLARSGYFDLSELATHRKINSRLQGHPATEEGLPGIRMSSGSLGQGLSCAIGAAETKKLNGDDKLTYVLMGDGEIQEGQVWEAAMYAAHNKIDNVIATIDYNGQQIDGPISEIMDLLDLEAKWTAFGWDVITCEDGNDMQQVLNSIQTAKDKSGNGKPVMILLKTSMGFGVDFMAGTHKWHGNAPNDEQLADALGQLKSNLQDY